MRKPTKAEVKSVVVIATGFCVRSVVATAICNVVPTENKVQKTQLFVATYVIAGMVRTHAKEYVAGEFDDWTELFSSIKKTSTETPATEE